MLFFPQRLHLAEFIRIDALAYSLIPKFVCAQTGLLI